MHGCWMILVQALKPWVACALISTGSAAGSVLTGCLMLAGGCCVLLLLRASVLQVPIHGKSVTVGQPYTDVIAASPPPPATIQCPSDQLTHIGPGLTYQYGDTFSGNPDAIQTTCPGAIPPCISA